MQDDIKVIESAIVTLKKLQRETRRSIRALRELQEVKDKEEEKDGISGEARGGIY